LFDDGYSLTNLLKYGGGGLKIIVAALSLIGTEGKTIGDGKDGEGLF